MAEEAVNPSAGEALPENAPVSRTEAVKEAMTAEKPVEVPEKRAEKSEHKYNEILARIPLGKTAVTPSDDEIVIDARSIRDTTDEESRVQKLIDLASSKGVAHAVKVARSLNDYYALDRLHDDLSDDMAGKLYQGLLEKGLITAE